MMRVSSLDGSVTAALQRASQLGVHVIARFQDAQYRSFTFQDGTIEGQSGRRSRGIGVHAVTSEGWLGFASSDATDPRTVAQLVDMAAAAARTSGRFGADVNRAIFEVEAQPVHLVPSPAEAADGRSMEAHQRAVRDVHEEARGEAGTAPLRTSHSVTDVEWRIARSDGTDVQFSTPNAYVSHELTVRGSSGAVAARASLSGGDARILTDAEPRRRLAQRFRVSRDRAVQTVDAPSAPSGPARLVIDYALAKGLAHEAFGHASESDGMETSLLGAEGRLKVGERVAPADVSIIDGPLVGDFAYQPISANGLTRETVSIVDHGVLRAGLGDLFSAGQAGMPVSGACRAESVFSGPLPRMTNIRIEVDQPLPLVMPFDEVTPAVLRGVLQQHGLLNTRARTLYLSGYRGGQVNPKTGDFVFNCAAIYDLTDGVRACKPAIFSGRSLSALQSIIAGLGPLYLDAMGFCGKSGQTVPSSGGSHAFLVLERNPDVSIGGEG
jgi:TldD protein